MTQEKGRAQASKRYIIKNDGKMRPKRSEEPESPPRKEPGTMGWGIG